MSYVITLQHKNGGKSSLPITEKEFNSIEKIINKNFFIMFKSVDGLEVEIDLLTSSPALAKKRAYNYVRGGEGIIEYAYLSNGFTNLEFSYSTCEWEAA